MGTTTERKLSYDLIDHGFFSALGTTEVVGAGARGTVVGLGTPLTTDYNNGVYVVYDETGRPWIKRNVTTEDGLHFAQFNLKRGAYVPHSNDGGYFVREVLPKLMGA